jgi:flagellar biogenesis protein FliO
MTKFIGNKTKSAMKSKYMRVVDSMALGFDKTLYLVKVGEQYILMHSSAKGFEFICNLNSNLLSVDLDSEDSEQHSGKGFSKYLDFFKPGTETKVSKEDNEIQNNIEKLKKMFNRKD